MYVACKMPNGLVIAGAGKTVTLLGAMQIPTDSFYRQAGFAITANVPKDVWEAWYELHKNSELVENKLILADENERVLIARLNARPYQSAKSGMEQMRG